MKELIGKVVGGYELKRLLGMGGMGAVYEALDQKHNRSVALKFLLRRDKSTPDWLDQARRLRDEAKAASRLQLAHLVHVLDCGDDEELGPFIVYELLPGQSLKQYLQKSGPMGDDAMELLIRPLLQTLQALHNGGIVHRDVKPENLLAGADKIFALGDLGLAYFEGRQAHTKTGFIIGTPGYLPPEAYVSASEPGPEQDCYSAALVIAEALAGCRLFGDERAMEKVKDQLTWEPSEGKLVRMGVPRWAAGPLTKGLSNKPKERISSPEELLQLLEVSFASRVGVVAATETIGVKKKEEKSKNSAAFLVLSLVAVLLFFFAFAKNRQRTPETREVVIVSSLAALPEPNELFTFFRDCKRFLTELRSLRPQLAKKRWLEALAEQQNDTLGVTLLMAERASFSGKKREALEGYKQAGRLLHERMIALKGRDVSLLLPNDTMMLCKVYLNCEKKKDRINVLARAMRALDEFPLAIKHSPNCYGHLRFIPLLVALNALDRGDELALKVTMPTLGLFWQKLPENEILRKLAVDYLSEIERKKAKLSPSLLEELESHTQRDRSRFSFDEYLNMAEKDYNRGRKIYAGMQDDITKNIMDMGKKVEDRLKKVDCVLALERSFWTATSLAMVDPETHSKLPGLCAHQIFSMRSEVLPLAQLYIGGQWTESLTRSSLVCWGQLDLERLAFITRNTRSEETRIKAEAQYLSILVDWLRDFHITEMTSLATFSKTVQALSPQTSAYSFTLGVLAHGEKRLNEGFSLQEKAFALASKRVEQANEWGDRWRSLHNIAIWRWALLRRAGKLDFVGKEAQVVMDLLARHNFLEDESNAQRLWGLAVVNLGHTLLKLNRRKDFLEQRKNIKKVTEIGSSGNVKIAAAELLADRPLNSGLYLH